LNHFLAIHGLLLTRRLGKTLISFLSSSGAINPSGRIAQQDLKVGLPNLLICLEMAIFSILHLWAFPWRPYSLANAHADEVTDFYGNGKATYQGGRWGMKALVDSVNPLDLAKAVGRSIRWLFVGRKKRTLDPSYQNQSEVIGLDTTSNGSGTNITAYQGAGATMVGGRPAHYGTSPDDEGQVLLSHAQPNPTLQSTGDLAPPPYDYEHDRLSSASLLEPSPSHSPQPYSPYEPHHNNPYEVPDTNGLHLHAGTNLPQSQQGATGHHPYDRDYLQEQPPIPMPDPYQPPPAHFDNDHSRR
jgi:hypothetical protein